MRLHSVVLMTLALALVAVAATAQTVCVPSSGTSAQVPATNETIVTVVTPAQPAGFGAGPVNQIALVPQGPMFEQRYVQLAYQQHSDIAALAGIGNQRAADPDLRSLSGKMIRERLSLNQGLQEINTSLGGTTTLAGDPSRIAEVQQSLSNLSGPDFDRSYAVAMLVLLQQENRLANEATFKSDGRLFDQVNKAKRTSYNEVKWFQGWVDKNVGMGIQDTPATGTIQTP